MTKKHSRPIKTERDYKGAASVADKIRGQPEREPAAERRLQALIDAMDKYDEADDGEGADDATDDIDGLPRRRWSDGDEG